MTAAAKNIITDEDRLRADFYNLFGVLLAAPPTDTILDQTAALTGDDSPMGQAIITLAKLAKNTKPANVNREYNALFIGLGRGEILPYASYYLTGFLNEKPLALLRQDMRAWGLTRSESVFEPEDNIASLMEIMGTIIVGRFGPPASLADQQEFFARHISPWAGHFFDDLESAKSSVFYSAVGRVGRIFIEIETEAFRMGA